MGLNGNWANADRWSGGLVPTAVDDVQITAPGTYFFTISTAALADTLFISEPGVTVRETAAGSITADDVQLSAGTLELRAANTITQTTVSGGLLKLGHASALGTGVLELNGGETLGTITETIANDMLAGGTPTIAAAHGTVLTLDGHIGVGAGTRLLFGEGANDGTVVVSFSSMSVSPSRIIEVGAGTLATDGTSLNTLLSGSAMTQIDAGATLDASDHALTLGALAGAGTLTNTGASIVNISMTGGTFAGTVAGQTLLQIEGSTTFTGTVTPGSGTVIFPGETLTLGDGGTSGTIKGIVDGSGTLAINRSDTMKLSADLDGTLSLSLVGPGTVKISQANAYSGTTTIDAGVLSLSNAAALGTSEIQFNGGEILATASFDLTNSMFVAGAAIVAAKTGTTFGFKPSDLGLGAGATLILGTPGAEGTILFDRGGGGTAGSAAVSIRAGTVQLLDNSFNLYAEVRRPHDHQGRRDARPSRSDHYFPFADRWRRDHDHECRRRP